MRTERSLVVADTIGLLQDIRAEQARQAAVLAAILQAIDRTSGPRDEADAALLLAIRESVADRPFTAAELIEHAKKTDPELVAALAAADIVNAADVGTLFRRLQGVNVNGLSVERLKKSRGGRAWRVRL